MHVDADVASHKQRQAEEITRRVTDRFTPFARAHVLELRQRLEQMSPQLYVQSVLMFELIAHVIEHGTMYYSQRRPSELGAFHWAIDAKDRVGTTDWEKWWSRIIGQTLQSRSITERPMARMAEGDYSSFDRYSREEIPEYIKPHLPRPPGPAARFTDVGKVLGESFRFSADTDPGLEMADVVVNATRRALVGNLGTSGWGEIRELMIHRPHHYVDVIALRRDLTPKVPATWPASGAPRHFSVGGRNMLAPRFRERRAATRAKGVAPPVGRE